ncbi:MAG: hypothetical protein H0X14_00015 [Acidobacteria bacterium]|nr:hypothetical protein [Acidobacteriota bacterium]
MAKHTCPYCSDPGLFDKRLAPTKGDQLDYVNMSRRGSHWPKAKRLKIVTPAMSVMRWGIIDPRESVSLKTPGVIRGKLRIKIVTDADMINRYAGFKVEIIGEESGVELPTPVGTFFSRTWTEDVKGKRQNFISFNAARITHKDSPVIVDIHWHPSHGRLVTLRGFSKVAVTPEELSIISTALGFDNKTSTRGAPPKVDRDAIIRAIRAQGEKATQKSVAAATGLATRTLRDWLYFREGSTWENLKRELTGGEL